MVEVVGVGPNISFERRMAAPTTSIIRVLHRGRG